MLAVLVYAQSQAKDKPPSPPNRNSPVLVDAKGRIVGAVRTAEPSDTQRGSPTVWMALPDSARLVVVVADQGAKLTPESQTVFTDYTCGADGGVAHAEIDVSRFSEASSYWCDAEEERLCYVSDDTPRAKETFYSILNPAHECHSVESLGLPALTELAATLVPLPRSFAAPFRIELR